MTFTNHITVILTCDWINKNDLFKIRISKHIFLINQEFTMLTIMLAIQVAATIVAVTIALAD